MGFNRENYRRVKREYDARNLAARETAERRREELHIRFPVIADLDRQLSATGFRILDLAAKYRGEELEREIIKAQEENNALLTRRCAVLAENGLPADYSDVHYECRECSDTGFCGLNMCACMRRRLILAGYESSGIGALIREKSFDNFRVDMPGQTPEGIAAARMNLHACSSFANGFGDEEKSRVRNILMIGPTGLGKTHLSAAVCRTVIDRGYDCICETAQNLFSDFEYERFSRPYATGDSETPARTDRYFDCDLLIMDDLGTEMTNQFTVSCLYNLINTRLNRGRSMIINTNLTRDELNKRYSDRIASRLFGEFYPLMFSGKDVRFLKLNQ